MNVPLNNCIYCSATEKLNTQLGIALEDGTKIQVLICDEHAEEASVKTARAAYLERLKKIDEFMAQAKALGLQLSPSGGASGLMVATGPAQVAQALAQGRPVSSPLSDQVASQQASLGQMAPNGQLVSPILEADEGMVEASRVDRAGRLGMVSVGGAVPAFGAVPAYASHNTADIRQQLPTDALKGKVKLEQVEDRAGRTIAIPAKRVDGMGVTHIRVVNTGGDQALQRRFKDMARATICDQHPGFSENYDLKPCPVCKGQMIVRDRGQDISCPKCGGQGLV